MQSTNTLWGDEFEIESFGYSKLSLEPSKSWHSVYLHSGRGFGKNYMQSQWLRYQYRKENRVRAGVNAKSPAAASELKWAGYDLRVRRLTREELAQRRNWRWMNGYWGAGATEEMLNDPKVWGMYTQVHEKNPPRKVADDVFAGKQFLSVQGYDEWLSTETYNTSDRSWKPQGKLYIGKGGKVRVKDQP